MRVDHPQLNKRDRRAEPSFWVQEPTDEAHSLIEENARLRELLSQLSDIIRKNGVHAR